MMVNIKQVTEQPDIKQLVLMAEALHRESPTFNTSSFNGEMLAKKIANVISLPNGVAFIAQDESGPIGYFIAGIFENFFNNQVIAFDYSVYVLPDKRNGRTAIKLIKAFEQWAKENGASYCQIGITTAINQDKTSKFYQLLGFKPYGFQFQKRL